LQLESNDPQGLAGAEPPPAPPAVAAPQPAELPEAASRKVLAGRLIIFGAIPIAVFCAFFVLMRAFLGIETVQNLALTLSISLLASMASLFVLSSLTAPARSPSLRKITSHTPSVAESTSSANARQRLSKSTGTGTNCIRPASTRLSSSTSSIKPARLFVERKIISRCFSRFSVGSRSK
jgi:hypothetical protein